MTDRSHAERDTRARETKRVMVIGDGQSKAQRIAAIVAASERISPVADPTTPADRAALITMTEQQLEDGSYYERDLKDEIDAQRRARFQEAGVLDLMLVYLRDLGVDGDGILAEVRADVKGEEGS